MPEALIWGASGGMGAALVRLLKREGWLVFAAAREERRIPIEADYTFAFDALQPHTIQSIPMQIASQSEGLDMMVRSGHDGVCCRCDGCRYRRTDAC